MIRSEWNLIIKFQALLIFRTISKSRVEAGVGTGAGVRLQAMSIAVVPLVAALGEKAVKVTAGTCVWALLVRDNVPLALWSGLMTCLPQKF